MRIKHGEELRASAATRLIPDSWWRLSHPFRVSRFAFKVVSQHKTDTGLATDARSMNLW